MSKIERVENVLLNNNTSPGLTAKQVARKARVDVATVHRRVSDLRNLYGMTIYSNYRIVNGRKQLFYRAA